MNKPEVSRLVPLEIAAQCIYSAAYDEAPTNERLTGLAQALVALVPVYLRGADGEASPIPEGRLRDARVRDCGNEMCFADGSPAMTQLFVSSSAMDYAIKLLAEPPQRAPRVPPPHSGNPPS